MSSLPLRVVPRIYLATFCRVLVVLPDKETSIYLVSKYFDDVSDRTSALRDTLVPR